MKGFAVECDKSLKWFASIGATYTEEEVCVNCLCIGSDINVEGDRIGCSHNIVDILEFSAPGEFVVGEDFIPQELACLYEKPEERAIQAASIGRLPAHTTCGYKCNYV